MKFVLAAIIVQQMEEVGAAFSSSSFGLKSRTPFSLSSQINEESTIATATAVSGDDFIQASIGRAMKDHEFQFHYGSQIFGESSSSPSSSLIDADFISYNVGVGNGGPTELAIRNGHLIFETADAILSVEECEYLIQSARQTIAREKENDKGKDEVTNSDLGELRLSNLPAEALEKVKTLLKDQLYPILENRFGGENTSFGDLAVYDGLVLGTIAPSVSQPVHRDASLLTLNIPLSAPEAFVGGGTYVEGLKDGHNGFPLRMGQGKALCHSSGVLHAGTSIQQGERWVMVMFVVARDEPQIARRTHAEGLDAMHAQALDMARAAFTAGLQYAPKDHLLHMGVGQVASMMRDGPVMMDCLATASRYYPSSHKAAMTLGNIMLGNSRPRAALRHFERVLSDIDDKDLLDGSWMPLKSTAWEARSLAARSALICAEYEYSKGWHTYQTTGKQKERNWSKENLPIAIERLRTALIPAPDNEPMGEMLHRCEELLKDAYECNNLVSNATE
mmetsp:Transcript_13749/g.20014  ORF Transcript_13749/g.20014 Transcript_13749/m.20014 type:complete len:505 (-) Transcript_13749:39-1553(-)